MITLTDTMKSFLVGTCALLTSAQFAHAENHSPKLNKPILVEMFTSQNCPACPAANEKLIELTDELEIFPLTWSVSYWDYLGWNDTFAKTGFNERQRDYADSFGLRGPYTPQTVVDGCMQTSGRPSKSQIRKKVDMTRKPHGADVDIGLISNILTLTASSNVPELEVIRVSYLPGITTIVPGDGFNRNKVISHINIVTDVEVLDDWSGKETGTFDVTCPDEACIVIVQEKQSNDIVDYFPITPNTA